MKSFIEMRKKHNSARTYRYDSLSNRLKVVISISSKIPFTFRDNKLQCIKELIRLVGLKARQFAGELYVINASKSRVIKSSKLIDQTSCIGFLHLLKPYYENG
ncbi:MAG: hypothetical protein AAF551_01485 [Bacteroidota bacterium]